MLQTVRSAAVLQSKFRAARTVPECPHKFRWHRKCGSIKRPRQCPHCAIPSG
ncbi:hypothetical protein BMF35_a1213 [Aurantiacibacter gangjinensis]|nr:hypothetical protein BMF35_a1213 [Aurantiacibacter gangjinensis]